MTTQIDFPDLDAATDEQSWEWLKDDSPRLADAIAAEIKRGHTPADIKERFMRQTQRKALALRLEQAARHLARGEQ